MIVTDMKKIFYLISAAAVIFAACTNLDEQIYSKIHINDFDVLRRF